MPEAGARIAFYRGGRARCGWCRRSRIGQHRTISGYAIASCPSCSRPSVIFGAHGYCGVLGLTDLQANRHERGDLSVADVLADLGVFALDEAG